MHRDGTVHCPVFQCPGRRASEAIVVFSLIVQFQKRLREEGRFSFSFGMYVLRICTFVYTGCGML